MKDRSNTSACFLRMLIAVTAIAFLLFACNNPFSTRTPQEPTSGGVAIRPANTPENVLYNMRVAFEGLSTQDFLDIFSEDFMFNPDPEDSSKYDGEYSSTWNKERETDFVNNFFLTVQSDTLAVDPVSVTIFNYEYEPGQDMYVYEYEVEIDFSDVYKVLSGRAWLFLREESDGKWYIYQWADHQYEKDKITFGELRALYY